MKRAVLIALCSAFCLDCGPRLDLTPTVYLDSAFTDVELKEVYAGLYSWEKAMPGEVRFEVAAMPTASMAAQVETGQDVVYVFRSREDCFEDLPTEDAGMFWGFSELGQRVNGAICFDIDSADARPGQLKRAAMHELGHALGLGHTAAPSVMTPSVEQEAADVTCKDRQDLAALWSLPAPSC